MCGFIVVYILFIIYVYALDFLKYTHILFIGLYIDVLMCYMLTSKGVYK